MADRAGRARCIRIPFRSPAAECLFGVNRVNRIYLINSTALAFLGEIRVLDGKSGSGGAAGGGDYAGGPERRLVSNTTASARPKKTTDLVADIESALVRESRDL